MSWSNRLAGVLGGLLWLSASSLAGPAPRIACDQPVHQFGAADRSQSVEHTFLLRNLGDAPLLISGIRGCCGAATLLATNSVGPGTNTTLHVKLSLRGRQGKQRKSFYVLSNDPQQSFLQLRMEGHVVARVDVNPQCVNFGTLEPAAKAQAVATVVCDPTIPLRVTNAFSSTALFACSLDPADTARRRVSVCTVPPLPQGVSRGQLRLLTDNPQHPEITVEVTAVVPSPVIVVPREIVLAEPEGAPTPTNCYVAVRARNAAPFRILAVRPPDPAIRASVGQLPGGGWRVELNNVLAFPDLDGRNLVLTTDIKGAEDVVIPVRIKEQSAPGDSPSPVTRK